MDAQDVKLKHDRSVAQYPEIDLRDDEYVVLAMRRSNVGVAAIWAVVGLCIVALSVILVMISKGGILNNNLIPINAAAKHYLWMSVTLFYIVILLAGLIGQTVYASNRLWVTNRRAIQKIRVSLFSNSTQVIELIKIEDVSFRQNGILQSFFKVGTLRMSTVGAETTYTFPMLDTPRDEVEIISNLALAARSRKRGDRDESYDMPSYYQAAPVAPVVAAPVIADEDPITEDIAEVLHSAPRPSANEASRSDGISTPTGDSTDEAEYVAVEPSMPPVIDPAIGELAPCPMQPVTPPRTRSRRSYKD